MTRSARSAAAKNLTSFSSSRPATSKWGRHTQTRPQTRGTDQSELGLTSALAPGHSGWLTARDLSLLTPREIDTVLENPKKLKKEIIEGYKVAQDPTEWKRERADKHAEWVELQEQMAAEEDQLEDDDAPEPAAKADGKKRKRPSAAAKDGDKKKKTPAKAPKSKGVRPTTPCAGIAISADSPPFFACRTMMPRLRPRRPRSLPLVSRASDPE